MSAEVLSPAVRAAYLQLLEGQYGLRASASQRDEIDTAVVDVLARSEYTHADDLYAALASGLHPELLESLATWLTIGETHFFRVTPQIEALRRVILPDLIARHAGDHRLRVWSAGCSTGEEPYTLAMLIREQLAAPREWDIQLVGTDLNRAALAIARLALYGDWSFRDVPDHLRDRYFSRAGSRWQLNAPIQRMVSFAQLNLTEDQFPFVAAGERPDLIVCRNVTIYFGQDTTQRLYQRFAEALAPESWLMLGPSDPAPAAAAGFEMLVLDNALVWRRRSAPLPLAPSPTVVERAGVARLRPSGPTRPARPLGAPAAVARHEPVPGHSSATSTDAQVHLAAGMLQLEEGATAAAIESLRRAALLDESSALAQFSLGRAFREQGAIARSRSAFFRARRLLAAVADDQPLADAEVDTSDLRHAIDVQLADLERAGT